MRSTMAGDIKKTALICLIIQAMLMGCGPCVNKSKTFNDYYENGSIKEHGIIQCGQRQGVWKKWHKNGQLQSETCYQQGKKHGPAKSYYENGKLYIESFYKNDQLIGVYKMYYRNGILNFKDSLDVEGKSEGLFELWHKDGTVSQIGINKKGKPIGKWIKYFSNGNAEHIKFYSENGLKRGNWLYFNFNGDTIRIEKYRNDSLVNIKN